MNRFLAPLAILLAAALAAGCAAKHAPQASGASKSAGATAAPAAGATPVAAPAEMAKKPAAPGGSPTADLLGDMDRSADPCSDFFRYSCGGWLDRTEIPADEVYWGRSFSTLEKRNQENLKEILEAAGSPAGAPATRKMGDFYATCMDEAAIEAKGAAPLRPWLEKVDGVKDTAGLFNVVGALHAAGVGGLFGTDVDTDLKNPGMKIAYFEQGGLSLFDRDYYLSDDPQKKGLKEAYQGHVGKMLVLLGESEADAKTHAASIVAFETELAKLARPRTDLRDLEKNYNKVGLEGLEKLAPGLPWKAYLAAAGNPGWREISVNQPEFYQGLQPLVAKTDPAILREYLRWQVVHAFADYLPKAFVDEDFAFYGQMIFGQKEIKPRWKRCVAMTDGALGEMLGKSFVEKVFPGDSKGIAIEMIKRIEAGLRRTFPTLAWMDDATRARAEEKLDMLTNKIGYPDKWRDYSGLQVTKGDLFTSALASRRFEYRYHADKVGGPADRGEWLLTPPTVNAYYNPTLNEMVFPAGILQAPMFSREYPAALNYGAIGAVMGHELTHGYDDEGRKFDGRGQMREWWEPSVSERFEQQAKCVEDTYSSYELQPGVKINGKLTLGENIADLGGIKEAYQAYKAWEREHGAPPRATPEFTNDQLFFISFAQTWCAIVTPEIERFLVTIDTHSLPKYRVIGSLSNYPVFGETFSCKEGSPLRPAKVCTVW